MPAPPRRAASRAIIGKYSMFGRHEPMFNHAGRALAASLLAWVCSPGAAGAQPLDFSSTIREALTRSGFARAAEAADAPAIDEVLTSSDFGVAANAFAAGYYFRSELSGDLLGPFHLSVFDARTGRWTHARPPDAPGSIFGVYVTDRSIVVQGHDTPSSGPLLVFDRTTLTRATAAQGCCVQVLPSGTIAFIGHMTHFAATHQYRLFVIDAVSRTETLVFPRQGESRAASGFRRAVQAAYRRLPAETKAEYDRSYGPVDDFDRTIRPIVESRDGKRLAFVSSYWSNRLQNEGSNLTLQTVVRCERGRASWRCDERTLENMLKTLRVAPPGPPVDGDGNRPGPPDGLDDGMFEPLLRQVVERP